MAKGAANQSAMSGLHSSVARMFQRVLDMYEARLNAADTIDPSSAEDEILDALMAEKIEPSPAMLSAITKFLKDNEINFDSEEIEELGATERRLANRKKNRPDFSNIVDLPLQENG